ncbi:hypothetical protein ACIQUQ_01145 [Streptomyces sp. NPDC101118]|uniref:hypothetical protein n=1 Tax=Streptomyces sp. NPDC101118 TaxID=3366109 RepID=UPI00380C97E5
MGFFRKRPEIDHVEQDRKLQQAKREGSQRLNAIRDRIGDGTATREDMRVFNAVVRRGRRK